MHADSSNLVWSGLPPLVTIAWMFVVGVVSAACRGVYSGIEVCVCGLVLEMLVQQLSVEQDRLATHTYIHVMLLAVCLIVFRLVQEKRHQQHTASGVWREAPIVKRRL